MKCPTCVDVLLVMSERQGVEIDYCPQCRGVWLVRGELDKLLERAAAQSASAPAKREEIVRGEVQTPYAYPPAQREYAQPRHDKYYKHKSWLSDIFD